MPTSTIDTEEQAIDALCSGAHFRINGEYIDPSDIVRYSKNAEGNPQFTLSDGTTVTHDPLGEGSTGHLLFAALNKVRGRNAERIDPAIYLYTFPAYSRTSRFDYSTQNSGMEGAEFFGNGTKLLTAGDEGGEPVLYEYDLSTAYDLNTATYNGNKQNLSNLNVGINERPIYIFSGNNDNSLYVVSVYNYKTARFDFGTQFDISTLTFHSEKGYAQANSRDHPRSACFSPDGSAFFEVADEGDLFRKRTASTPWDLSTVGGVEQSFNMRFDGAGSTLDRYGSSGIHVAADGSAIVCFGRTDGGTYKFYVWKLSVPFDVQTRAEVTEYPLEESWGRDDSDVGPESVVVSSDGTRFVLVDGANSDVNAFAIDV